MTASDRGVRANLLDRKFGSAGTGSDLTRHAEIAAARARLRDQRAATKKLTEMQTARPKLPPGRTR